MAFGPFANQDGLDPYSRNLLIQRLRQPTVPGLPQAGGFYESGGITGPATGATTPPPATPSIPPPLTDPVQAAPPTAIGPTPYAGALTTEVESMPGYQSRTIAQSLPGGTAGPAMPGASPAPSILPRMTDPVDPLAGYARRGGGTGGVGSGALSGAATGAGLASVLPGIGTLAGGAIGGIVGGIKGAFGKHAASAPTDFATGDARQAIADAYLQQLGRPATEQEITQHLQNTGWQQGDEWSGEAGLRHILDTSIGQSPEAAAFAASGGAAGVPPPAAAGATAPPGAPGATPPAPGAAGAPPPAAAATSGKVQTKAPLGFDQTKWNDPNHKTIKYVAGRILSKYGPLGKHNMPQAWAEIKAAFPKATWDGGDAIDFGDGFGPIDVVNSYDTGKGHVQWHVPGSGKGKGGKGGPADQGRDGMGGGSVSGVSSPLLGGDPIAAIQALLNDRTRQEMLRQLQGLIPGGVRGTR